MAEAIFRQISRSRGARMQRDSLEAAILPANLSAGSAGQKMFIETLRELISIGAVLEKEGEIPLPGVAPMNPAAMSRIVRDAAFDAEQESRLWEKDEAGSLVLTGAR